MVEPNPRVPQQSPCLANDPVSGDSCQVTRVGPRFADAFDADYFALCDELYGPIKERKRVDHDRPGYIYFIQSGEDGPIKIGFARDPHRRFGHIQGSNPAECRLLGVLQGTPKLERKLHRRFRDHLIRGEWFQAAPVVAWLSEATTWAG